MIMKGCAQWNPVYDRKDPQTIEDQIVGCVWQVNLKTFFFQERGREDHKYMYRNTAVSVK